MKQHPLDSKPEPSWSKDKTHLICTCGEKFYGPTASSKDYDFILKDFRQHSSEWIAAHPNDAHPDQFGENT
jgi:hypothetical protein